MKTITGILIALQLLTNATAQRLCGSEAYTAEISRTNPAALNGYREAEAQIIKTLGKSGLKRRDTAANEIIYIPVVVHVLYKTAAQNISDAQILSQLESLNKDFAYQNEDKSNTPKAFRSVAADVKIKFCLAQVAPDGKRTNGIIRKYTNTEVFSADDAMKYALNGGSTAWNSRQYLNIWVCNLGGRSLGYATQPGGPANLDGIVIAFDAFGTIGNLRPSFNKGRTATHEVGHWLGLKHIWGDTDCGDDGVEDTPRQKSYNYGCPSFPRVTTCSENENGDMFMNYMDFSDDACMNMFTEGQKQRMRALFATGNLRNSFLTSFACDSNLVQAGPIAAPVDTTVTPAPVAPVAAEQTKVYPNPVQNEVVIECKNASKQDVKQMAVFSITGNKVFTAVLDKEKTRFNFSFLKAGIYVVKIGEGKNVTVTKLVKQ
ncbi:MAG TPA: M43 family zinc metalloprotease [Ferruginibacter sp.]|nr:M43 family zinc metalloprotease [Ferruginibacter sp.]HMP20048.1 M43 family zinc metalloprotease [Ferruginibacter sp.]